eukprot:TRINITY_DN10501_c0_g2_i1.p1 TRINITY_DN10501_c0_g2~~TRINITY_DN10501_c0_g2_i1.p1  ORF type:complete len:297 (+),score=61.29 TRINITY_DN10501_c0_g2_i1:131-1021(+)
MGNCCDRPEVVFKAKPMGICVSTNADEVQAHDKMSATAAEDADLVASARYSSARNSKINVVHVLKPEQEAEFEKVLSRACPPERTMVRAAIMLRRKLEKARVTIRRRTESEAQLEEAEEAEPQTRARSFTQAAADFDRTKSREEDIVEGIQLLDERLKNHNMVAEPMKDDGNCQFRALSHQLYGDQELHGEVRSFVVAHIREHADEYQLYCDEDINAYITRMSRDRVWGDELTLKAAVDAYKATVHAVTSNKENWHLVYTSDSEGTPKPDPISDEARKKLFLAYISPVHYLSLIHI